MLTNFLFQELHEFGLGDHSVAVVVAFLEDIIPKLLLDVDATEEFLYLGLRDVTILVQVEQGERLL
jgi:hypothetical protein